MNNPKADYTHYMFGYYDLRCFPNRESNLYITNIQRFLGCPNESGVYDEELRKTVIDYQKNMDWMQMELLVIRQNIHSFQFVLSEVRNEFNENKNCFLYHYRTFLEIMI